ncbi:hypothetical protein GQ43DRAFT_358267, partial [Delitschia confertaspora ATCC 74209]
PKLAPSISVPPTTPDIEQSPARQLPSNSTSPQLANTLAPPADGSPIPQANTMFPSPAPSEETNVMRPDTNNTDGASRVAGPVTVLESPREAQPAYSFPTAPQQSVVKPDHFTRQDCLVAIQTFYSRNSIREGSTDQQRMDVLKEAVGLLDWPYMTLHQYYCLASLDRQYIPSNLLALSSWNQGMAVITEVLDTNNNLSPVVLRWFANFPMTLLELRSRWPRQFEEQMKGFERFVESSKFFTPLKQICQQRRYPPLVGELESYLGIESRVFQKIVFTAIRRSFWSRRDLISPSEYEVDKVFTTHQDYYYQRKKELPPQAALLYAEQFTKRDYQQFGERFKQLYIAHEQWTRQRSSHPPPRAPGSVMSLPTLPSQPEAAPTKSMAQAQAPVHYPQSIDVPSGQHIRSQQTNSPTTPSFAAHARKPDGTVVLDALANASGLRGGGHQPAHPAVLRSVQPIPSTPHLAQPNPSASRAIPPNPSASRTVQQNPSAIRTVQPRCSARQQKGYFLPDSGWSQPQPTEPNPSMSALHQVHLRSPLLRGQEGISKLYQYFKSFALAPRRLDGAAAAVVKWTFEISEEAMKTIPIDIPGSWGEPNTRVLNVDSEVYRLRCAKWSSPGVPDEQTWAVTGTSWVSCGFFSLNGSSLIPRRKLHNGKDLPIDITPLLKAGTNTLEMTILQRDEDESYLKYFMAIEVIGMKRHEDIRHDCLTMNYIPATETVAAIKKRLNHADTDDEIAIVQSSLSIQLFDPFSASRMCDIPVRGKYCLHYDCFDLETFLNTRKRKGDVSVADHWRCPICKGDARPHRLVVDGFLEEVGGKLAEQGLSNTRAIVVDADGAWKPK